MALENISTSITTPPRQENFLGVLSLVEYSVLPAPAVFILDTDGLVQFSYVNPNYRVRPSADLILSAARLLK